MNRLTPLSYWIIGLIGSLLIVALAVVVAHAQTPKIAEWDRNASADQVDHYELYVCTQAACDPLAGGVRIGADVPQTEPGVPRVSHALPSLPPVGRISVVAVDVLGQVSPQSNIVPFRQQPLNAPKGLLVK